MYAYYSKLYAITLIGFLAIDMIWLGLIARGFYREHLGYLMSEKPNWMAAIVFYLLFILGLLIFVVVPSLQADSWGKLLFLAAMFGLITYATYDLTNMATVRNWPWIVTVVDVTWGIVLSTSVSCISFLAAKWLSRNMA
jgi:uncharacterized membrane protein